MHYSYKNSSALIVIQKEFAKLEDLVFHPN